MKNPSSGIAIDLRIGHRGYSWFIPIQCKRNYMSLRFPCEIKYELNGNSTESFWYLKSSRFLWTSGQTLSCMVWMNWRCSSSGRSSGLLLSGRQKIHQLFPWEQPPPSINDFNKVISLSFTPTNTAPYLIPRRFHLELGLSGSAKGQKGWENH